MIIKLLTARVFFRLVDEPPSLRSGLPLMGASSSVLRTHGVEITRASQTSSFGFKTVFPLVKTLGHEPVPERTPAGRSAAQRSKGR